MKQRKGTWIWGEFVDDDDDDDDCWRRVETGTGKKKAEISLFSITPSAVWI